MSAVKSGLIGAAAIGGVIAVLFATGTVKLSGSGDEAAADGSGEDEADGAKKGKRKGRRKGRKGRRRRRGRGQDLRSLGYLAESRPEAHRNKRGVTVYDRERAQPGFVLYNYCGWGAGVEAGDDNPWGDTVLLSLEGKELHRWHTDLFGDDGGGISISKVLPNGDLVINRADLGVARLDFDSNTVWALEGVYHHDLFVEEDETVWVMAEREHEVPDAPIKTILDHGVTHISKSGEVLETIWFSETLADNPAFQRILARKRKRRRRADILHGNAVEILPTDGPDGLWKKGDILSSIRNLDMIIIVERETGKLLWSWGRGELQHQHAPVWAPENRFLVFDNGQRRSASRVLEVDPVAKQIVWKYEGTPSNPFFSRTRGTVEPLENGNVFVGSSNDGRMFQVDREGDVVWEYWTSDEAEGKVVPIRAGHVSGALQDGLEARLSGMPAAEADTAEPEGGEPDEAAEEPRAADGADADAKADETKADDAKAEPEQADESGE